MPALSLPKTGLIASTVQIMRDIIITLKLVTVNVLMNVNVHQLNYGDLILIVPALVEYLQFAVVINTLIKKLVDANHFQHAVAAHSVEVEVEATQEDNQEVEGDTLEGNQEVVEAILEDNQEVVMDTQDILEYSQVEVIIILVKILVVCLLKITTVVNTQYLVVEVVETD